MADGVMSDDFRCPNCRGPLKQSHRLRYFFKCDFCRRDFPLYVLEDAKRDMEKSNRSALERVRDALRKDSK